MSPRFIPAGIRPGMRGGLGRNVRLACDRAMPKQPRHSTCSHSDRSHADARRGREHPPGRSAAHPVESDGSHKAQCPCEKARAHPDRPEERSGGGRWLPLAPCRPQGRLRRAQRPTNATSCQRALAPGRLRGRSESSRQCREMRSQPKKGLDIAAAAGSA